MSEILWPQYLSSTLCSVSAFAVRNILVSSLEVFHLIEIKNTGFVRNKQPNTNAEKSRGL